MDLLFCGLVVVLGLFVAAGCRWSWFLTPGERTLAQGASCAMPDRESARTKLASSEPWKRSQQQHETESVVP